MDDGNRFIGTSGNREIEKPNLTTEARETQEIQIMISTSDLTSSNSPLCSFVSSVVNGFSVLTVIVLTGFALTIFVLAILGNFGIAGNSWSIGVRA
jgi:hypothetical protein